MYMYIYIYVYTYVYMCVCVGGMYIHLCTLTQVEGMMSSRQGLAQDASASAGTALLAAAAKVNNNRNI